MNKLRHRHDQIDDPIIQKFQHYDRLAAMLTRKIRSPITSRYTWQANKTAKKIKF